jgi:hypothetical protein
MNNMLIDKAYLPLDFEYPYSFIKATALSLVNLEPWLIMDGEFATLRLVGLRKRYPIRILIPFARRCDNDDIACFENGKKEEVQIVHDYASKGYEQRAIYNTFWDWFKFAIDEMIDFD